MPPSSALEASTKSHSSADVSLGAKLLYNLKLLKLRLPGLFENYDFAGTTTEQVEEVVALYEQRTGRIAAESTILEIGFGARPMRSFALSCFFKQVYAVDLDALVMGPLDLPRVFMKNGIERGLKSVARYFLFDLQHWRAFRKGMKARFPNYSEKKVTFVIGDASSDAVWAKLPERIDFVFSSDVFEHIPPADLERLMTKLREHLQPGSIIVTRPCVFTGISGGHDLEWYPHLVDDNDGATAWGHVIDKAFTVNTYVNRMPRREYAEMFKRTGFEILEDSSTMGELGAQHMTPAKRAELQEYDDYELFSNRVQFVLR
jgi:hypothetical protein